MFTGLIEEVGSIAGITRNGKFIDITVKAAAVLEDVAIGDSVAISGPCLTVTACTASTFTVQAVEETLRRTTLSRLKPGAPVNLERALTLSTRLGGHIVQGHVDGAGRIAARRGSADNVVFAIETDPAFERYIVEKGSVAVDGISLTVAAVRRGGFDVSVIAHTLASTTLSGARAGDEVNIETDIIAKYVEKLSNPGGSMTLESLGKLGF